MLKRIDDYGLIVFPVLTRRAPAGLGLNIGPALLLSYLINRSRWWEARPVNSRDGDGMYFSIHELEERTGLDRSQQLRCRQELIKRKFVNCVVKRHPSGVTPRITFYRVTDVLVDELLSIARNRDLHGQESRNVNRDIATFLPLTPLTNYRETSRRKNGEIGHGIRSGDPGDFSTNHRYLDALT